MRRIRRLITLKQRDIASYFGFIGGNSAIRVMKKLNFVPTMRELFILRARLKDDLLGKIIIHLPCLRRSHFTLLSLNQEVCRQISAKIYLGLCDNGEHGDMMRMLIEDTIHMCLTAYICLGVPNPWEDLLPLKTENQLKRTHDRLTALTNRHGAEDIPGQREFATPPFMENSSIQPIRSYNALKIEADEQQHCIASYVHAILRKEIYVYKVLSPERATLALRKNRYGEWEIEQLRGSHNSTVGVETKQSVEEWMSGNRTPLTSMHTPQPYKAV
jgi:hypothetical protein